MEGILSREQFAKVRREFEAAQSEYEARYARLLASIARDVTIHEARDLIANFATAAESLYRKRKAMETGDLNA